MDRPAWVIGFSILTIIIAVVTIVTGALAYNYIWQIYIGLPITSLVQFAVVLVAIYATLFEIMLFGSSSGSLIFIQEFSILVIALGILELVGVVGLLMLQRWGFFLTIFLNVVVLISSIIVGAVVIIVIVGGTIFAMPVLILIIYEIIFTTYLFAKREAFM